MKHIGRTIKTFDDYKPSYFFEKHFLSKEQAARNKRIDKEKSQIEKQKEKQEVQNLNEVLKQQSQKKKMEETGNKKLKKQISKSNKEIKKELKKKEKEEKKAKKAKTALIESKEDKPLLKVTLNNLVKLRSAADYNVKIKSEELKKKQKRKTSVKSLAERLKASQGIFTIMIL